MLRWPKLEPAAAREAAPLPKGGWHRPFRFHALEVVTATRAEAEAYEQAWRVKASREGWRIYAKPPGIVVNPHRRATAHVRGLAHQRRWQLGTPVKAPPNAWGGGHGQRW